MSRLTRRSFLANTAAAAAGTMLARSLYAQNAPAPAPAAGGDKKLGFALVGIGSLATGQLFPPLTGMNTNGNPITFPACKYAKCVAFVTGHRDRNLPIAARAGIKPEHVYTYENFDSIKDNPEVDVIYIVLPNSMHCEYTVRAAKAGKHVLCEKPMATSVADCEKMIAACKDAKKKLMIAYRMQFEPLTLKLIELCRDKDKIGKIIKIDARCGAGRSNDNYDRVWRIQKPLAGGGALMDMGVYALQSALYLAGEDPIEVNTTAYEGPDGGATFKDVEKNIVFDLKFASGLAATVTSAYTQATNRTQLTAEKGSLDLNPLMNYNGNRAYYSPKDSTTRTEVQYTWAHHFATEIDDFAQCVMQDKQTRASGEMGLRDMKIVYGAYESAKTGKPVKLV